MALQYLVTGWDPTAGDPDACITRAQLLQMVQAAKPYLGNGIGLVVKSDAAPDVATYPELADFIWLRSVGGVLNGEFYYYNGTSWTLLSVVDGSLLAAGSVTLAKISLAGATANYILQVNGTATALVWSSITTAIGNGTLNIAKLIGTGAGVTGVLTSISGTQAWSTPAVLAGLIPAGTIALTQLAVGGAGNMVVTSLTGVNQYVSFDAFMGLVTDGIIAQAKISISGGIAGQSRRINPGATAWEWFTPSSITTNIAVQSWPAVGVFAQLTFAHTLGVVPSFVRVVAVCKAVGLQGYAIGEQIDFRSIMWADGANGQFAVPIIETTTAVIVNFPAAGSVTPRLYNRNTDAQGFLTAADWNVRVYVGA